MLLISGEFMAYYHNPAIFCLVIIAAVWTSWLAVVWLIGLQGQAGPYQALLLPLKPYCQSTLLLPSPVASPTQALLPLFQEPCCYIRQAAKPADRGLQLATMGLVIQAPTAAAAAAAAEQEQEQEQEHAEEGASTQHAPRSNNVMHYYCLQCLQRK
jgi:hypothetical protein